MGTTVCMHAPVWCYRNALPVSYASSLLYFKAIFTKALLGYPWCVFIRCFHIDANEYIVVISKTSNSLSVFQGAARQHATKRILYTSNIVEGMDQEHGTMVERLPSRSKALGSRPTRQKLIVVECSSYTVILPSNRQNLQRETEKHLEIMDFFIILIVVMITHRWTYVPTHQIICTNYPQFLICHLYFDKTRKNISINIDSHY